MWPDRVSNPGPLTYESGALPTALLGPALAMLSNNEVTEGLLIAVLGANFVLLFFYRLTCCDSPPLF